MRRNSQVSNSQGEVSPRSESSNLFLDDSNRNNETALKFEGGNLKPQRQSPEIKSDIEILQTMSSCIIEFEEEVSPVQTGIKRNFQFNMREQDY